MVQAETNYRQFKSLLEQKARAQAEPQRDKGATMPHVTPAVDVLELEREVRVFVDMPGMAREHVNVAIAGDVLTIRGERQAPQRAQAGMMRLEERRKGLLLRSIALPPRVRRDGIEAALRDGVLTISIPTDGNGADTTEIPIDVK
jgi:HSP20 family protein